MEKLKIGDMVTLKHDKEKCQRMLTGISERSTGKTFALSCGTTETWHYEIEIEKIVNEEKIVKGFKQ